MIEPHICYIEGRKMNRDAYYPTYNLSFAGICALTTKTDAHVLFDSVDWKEVIL